MTSACGKSRARSGARVCCFPFRTRYSGPELDRIEAARAFATRAHAGVRRKVSGLPYIVHPFGVAAILADAGAPADLVAAGLLHDTVEDAGATVGELERAFGPDVGRLVACVTNDAPGSWRQRRRRMFERFASAPSDCILLKCADALDNLRSTRRDLDRYGDTVWRRLRSRTDLAWYYRGLSRLFAATLREGPGRRLSAEFQAEVRRVFAR